MSDDDVSAMLKSVPGAGPHVDVVIDAKHDLSDGLSNFVDDTVYSVKSTWRDLITYSPTNRIPRVVIELDPVRVSQQRPAEAVNPTPQMKETASAEPMKLMPKSPAITEPKKEEMENLAKAMPEAVTETVTETVSEKAPEKSPEEMPKDMAKPAAIPIDAAKPVTPKTEVEDVTKLSPAPKPAPEPVQPELPAAKPKPAPKKAEPAPPPAPPEQDGGTGDHKKGLAFYKGLGVDKDFIAAKKMVRTGG